MISSSLVFWSLSVTYAFMASPHLLVAYRQGWSRSFFLIIIGLVPLWQYLSVFDTDQALFDLLELNSLATRFKGLEAVNMTGLPKTGIFYFVLWALQWVFMEATIWWLWLWLWLFHLYSQMHKYSMFPLAIIIPYPQEK